MPDSGQSLKVEDAGLNQLQKIEKYVSGLLTTETITSSCGDLSFIPTPRIDVQGIGEVKTPLSEEQARRLIETSRAYAVQDNRGPPTNQFPCEIDPKYFKCSHQKWDTYVEALANCAVKKLNIRRRVSPRPVLWKMVLYQRGDRCTLPSRRKMLGDFGTLAICLPSEYRGGDVLAYHNGEKQVFNTSEGRQSYICWYSDMTPKVQELVSGYLWVLLYRLEGDRCDLKPAPRITSNFEIPVKLYQALKQWRFSPDGSVGGAKMMLFALDRIYDEGYGLCEDDLVGQDLDRGRQLLNVCSALDFDLYLAFAQKHVVKTTQATEIDPPNCVQAPTNCLSNCRPQSDDLSVKIILHRVHDCQGDLQILRQFVNVTAADFCFPQKDLFNEKPDEKHTRVFTDSDGESVRHELCTFKKPVWIISQPNQFTRWYFQYLLSRSKDAIPLDQEIEALDELLASFVNRCKDIIPDLVCHDTRDSIDGTPDLFSSDQSDCTDDLEVSRLAHSDSIYLCSKVGELVEYEISHHSSRFSSRYFSIIRKCVDLAIALKSTESLQRLVRNNRFDVDMYIFRRAAERFKKFGISSPNSYAEMFSLLILALPCIHSQYLALKTVTRLLENETGRLTGDDLAWAQNTIKRCLEIQVGNSLSVQDGFGLEGFARYFNFDFYLSEIVPLVAPRMTKDFGAMVGIICALGDAKSENTFRDPRLLKLYRDFTAAMLQNMDFVAGGESRLTCRNFRHPAEYDKDPLFDHIALGGLCNQFLQNNMIDEYLLVVAGLVDQLDRISKENIERVYLPFLGVITSGLKSWVPRGALNRNHVVTKCIRVLTLNLLIYYLRLCVPCPLPACSFWMKPVCSAVCCKDCSQLNAFLCSHRENKIHLVCNNSQHLHIQQVLKETGCDLVKDREPTPYGLSLVHVYKPDKVREDHERDKDRRTSLISKARAQFNELDRAGSTLVFRRLIGMPAIEFFRKWQAQAKTSGPLSEADMLKLFGLTKADLTMPKPKASSLTGSEILGRLRETSGNISNRTPAVGDKRAGDELEGGQSKSSRKHGKENPLIIMDLTADADE